MEPILQYKHLENMHIEKNRKCCTTVCEQYTILQVTIIQPYQLDRLYIPVYTTSALVQAKQNNEQQEYDTRATAAGIHTHANASLYMMV